jgi:hypothetical protein
MFFDRDTKQMLSKCQQFVLHLINPLYLSNPTLLSHISWVDLRKSHTCVWEHSHFDIWTSWAILERCNVNIVQLEVFPKKYVSLISKSELITQRTRNCKAETILMTSEIRALKWCMGIDLRVIYNFHSLIHSFISGSTALCWALASSPIS